MAEESRQTEKQTTSDVTVSFMTDDQGNKSSMRVMMVVALVAAIVLAGFLVTGYAKCEGPVENLALYFLLAAFGGKSAQKFAESMKSAQSTKSG